MHPSATFLSPYRFHPITCREDHGAGTGTFRVTPPPCLPSLLRSPIAPALCQVHPPCLGSPKQARVPHHQSISTLFGILRLQVRGSATTGFSPYKRTVAISVSRCQWIFSSSQRMARPLDCVSATPEGAVSTGQSTILVEPPLPSPPLMLGHPAQAESVGSRTPSAMAGRARA